MKKSNFFILAGAVTLGIASFYGKKPYFDGTVSHLYANTYGELFSSGNTSSFLTTTHGDNVTAQFKTTNGSWATLLTASGGAKVYLNHGQAY